MSVFDRICHGLGTLFGILGLTVLYFGFGGSPARLRQTELLKSRISGTKGEIVYIWDSLLITFNLVLGWRRTEKQWNWDQPKNKRTSEGIGDRQNAEIRNLESES